MKWNSKHKTALFCLLFSHLIGFSQSWTELQKIVASDRTIGDQFAHAVAISGDYAIVGAPTESEDASGGNTLFQAGSAYIYEKDGLGVWNQVAKIVASDRAPDKRFGFSVDISGNRAIVGAYPSGFGGLGAAYVFERNILSGIWSEVAILSRAAPSLDGFGRSVSIDGSYSIVGAFQNTTDASGNNPLLSAGAAYIFQRDAFGNWSEHQKIVAGDRSGDDNFGISVSIDGSYGVVGSNRDEHDASGNNPVGQHAGSAYFFERTGSTYNQVRKVTAINRTSGDEYGWSVDISGVRAVVSCNDDNEDISNANFLTDAGTAYIYERNPFTGWALDQHIEAFDRNAGAQFGWSVAIDNDYVIVGAFTESNDQNGMNTISFAGAAYLFERDASGTWLQEDKIVHSDRAAVDWFGFNVSISGLHAIIGALREDEDVLGGNTFSDAGSAYIFERSVILPVSLLSFSYEALEEQTKLNWNIGELTTNGFFAIERSIDGFEFEPIGEVSAQLNSTEYQFVDETPLSGSSYYRLSIHSLNEEIRYSDILSVYRDEQDIKIQQPSPNPVVNVLRIPCYVKQTTEFNVIMHDMQGKSVYQSREICFDSHHDISVDLSNQRAGMYQLTILHEEVIIHQSSIIKQ